jgi:hypothetical protein
MELPEARTPGIAKERRGYRPLEKLSVAPHKKKQKNLAPTWSFLMRADFLLFPALKEHGLPKGRRPISIISTVRIKSLPLRLSAFLHKKSELLSMSGSEHTTLQELMFGLFWNNFSGMFVTMLCFCGTEHLFTAAKKSSISWQNIQEFMLNGFLRMLQSLTQLSMSGTRRIHPWLTVSHTILPNSDNDYGLIRKIFGLLKNFFGRVYMPASFLGNISKCIHYLCETQYIYFL